MGSSIHGITCDCAEPRRLVEFWSAALGYRESGVDEEGGSIVHPDGLSPRLLFLKVPEGKVVKNRVHLDLTPDTAMEAEVERLMRLGARKIRLVAEYEDDVFTVMQDPEGNELCVEQPRGADRPGKIASTRQ